MRQQLSGLKKRTQTNPETVINPYPTWQSQDTNCLTVSNCFEEIAITEESLDEYEGKQQATYQLIDLIGKTAAQGAEKLFMLASLVSISQKENKFS